MTLEQGLLTLLNNDEQPLRKRLKIADNAFNSIEVQIPHREFFLLKWLLQTELSDNNVAIWNQCKIWLSSDSFQELKMVDFSNDEIKIILKRIQEQFKSDDSEILEILVHIFGFMLQSVTFHNFFQAHLDEYIIFLKNVFLNIPDKQVLLTLLSRHEKIFGKKLIIIPGFHIIFIEQLLTVFVQILVKFNNKKDLKLQEALSYIIQKNVFLKNVDSVKNFFKTVWDSEQYEENLLIKVIIEQLPSKNDQLYTYYFYKLLFDAFCRAYKNNVNIGYDMFVYLLGHLGFASVKMKLVCNQSANFETALTALSAMLETIAQYSIKFDKEINLVLFEHVLKDIFSWMIITTVTPMNTTCLDIVDLVMRIHPLTFVGVSMHAIAYLMVANNEHQLEEYTATWCSIWDMYRKSGRVQSLLHQVLEVMRNCYVGENTPEPLVMAYLSFEGKLSKVKHHRDAVLATGYMEMDAEKMVPDAVLLRFCSGTGAIPASAITHFFRTFVVWLNILMGDDLVEKSQDDKYVAYIGVLLRFLCHYMSQVNVAASNFRKENTTERTNEHMNNIRQVLEKMGNALVVIEHNQTLMKHFLQISFTWGELRILMDFIFVNDKENEVNDINDMEISPCNISALHSYLSSQKWCLIAERISNFGEQTCKKVMEKLWVQKIRYLMLSGMDKTTTNEHISTLLKSITPIEDYYEYLTTDAFASQVILERIDSTSLIAIAECVMNNAAQNLDILTRVLGSRPFVHALLYNVLKKMNKKLKKAAKANGCEFVSCAVFAHIGPNFLEEEVNVEELNVGEVFEKAYKTKAASGASPENSLNIEEFRFYFALLKKLPIVNLDVSTHTLLYYYLLAAFVDMKGQEGNDIVDEMETILLGIGQLKTVPIENLLPFKVMLSITVSRFKDVPTMFGSVFLMYKITCGEVLLEVLMELMKHLDDDTHMSCLLQFMQFVRRIKSKKTATNIKEKLLEILSQLCHALIAHIENKDTKNVSSSMHVLMECLQSVPMSDDINDHLNQLLDNIFESNSEITLGELSLFNFALSQEREDQQELITKIVTALKRTAFLSSAVTLYASTVQLILKLMTSVEDFQDFLDFLKQRILTLIDRPDELSVEMKVWHHISTTQLTTAKVEILMKINEEIILRLYKAIHSCDGELYEKLLDILMSYELQLIQRTQILITAPTFDLCFATITQRMRTAYNFETSYKRCVEILESMLRSRQLLVCDRVPVFLQEYRMLLGTLCSNSDTNKQLADHHYDQMAEYAHLLDRLTVNMCKLKQHIASVAFFVVADIIQVYETIPLYPGVKLALNNCLHSLIALCSQHAVQSLMRTLSEGSREIFKMVYEDYMKYHRFTGRV